MENNLISSPWFLDLVEILKLITDRIGTSWLRNILKIIITISIIILNKKPANINECEHRSKSSNKMDIFGVKKWWHE